MKFKIIITLIFCWNAMALNTYADEFKDLYCSIMSPDTTRASEITIYQMLNSQVPEMAINQDLSNKMVDKYLATHSDPVQDAFVNIYRKHFTLEEMRKLKGIIEADASDSRLQDIQTKMTESTNSNVIKTYVGNVLKEYNVSKNLKTTSVSNLPEGYYDQYINMLVLQQGDNFKKNINFTQLFNMALLNIEDENERQSQVEALNSHIQDDYFRYAATCIHKAGISTEDLKYLEKHFIGDPLHKKKSEADMDLTRINMGDLMSKYFDSYTEYLSSEGYQISPIVLDYMRDYFNSMKGLAQ